MILPKHYLSEDDLIRQCEEMRAKYKQLVSRLPKKHRKKRKRTKGPLLAQIIMSRPCSDEWSNWEYKSYTSDYLLRLEIETRRLESVINQKVIKTGSTRNFSFFGLRIGIWTVQNIHICVFIGLPAKFVFPHISKTLVQMVPNLILPIAICNKIETSQNGFRFICLTVNDERHDHYVVVCCDLGERISGEESVTYSVSRML